MKNLNKINQRKRHEVMQCAEAAKKYPRIQRMIIFGSSVTDCCDDQSDTDICISLIGGLKGLDTHEMSVEFNKICGHNCDIFFYEKLNGNIKDEIDHKGVVVYEKQMV